MNLNFFFEVLIGGLLSGVMYALVALGFVLIYKASGVFNFAQGAMVFFAALTCVSLTEFGWPLWVAIAATIVIMSLLGLAVERIVLRPLVNQPEISLFMATIGLSFFIEGMAQLMWGSDVKRLDLGIEDVPMESLMQSLNIIVSKFDVIAAGICALLVTGLALFFSRTKVGRALRAVAQRFRPADRRRRQNHAQRARRQNLQPHRHCPFWTFLPA
jgi:branched-chain amino acid transport system permease protein